MVSEVGMAKFSAPEPFNFAKPEDWPDWKQRFTQYCIATKLNKEPEEVQLCSLIYSMGPEAEQVYKSFGLEDDEDENGYNEVNDYGKVMGLFDTHFVPKRNAIFEHARFHSRTQEPGESVEQYMRHLYELAAHCEFTEKEEEIRDRLVIDMKDKDPSLKLQMTSNLTLKKAVDMARHSHLVKLQNTDTAAAGHVDEVKQKPFKNKWKHKSKGAMSGQADSERRNCGRCRCTHDKENCPAKGKECNKCHKICHFANKCKTKQIQEVTEDVDSLFLGSMAETPAENGASVDEVISDTEPPWRTTLNIGRTAVNIKIDSGADATITNEATFSHLHIKPKLRPVTTKLDSPGGEVGHKGQFMAKVLKCRKEEKHKITTSE